MTKGGGLTRGGKGAKKMSKAKKGGEPLRRRGGLAEKRRGEWLRRGGGGTKKMKVRKSRRKGSGIRERGKGV